MVAPGDGVERNLDGMRPIHKVFAGEHRHLRAPCVRLERVADGVAVAVELSGERRRAIADRRPVRSAEIDVRAERVGAGEVVRDRRESFARGDKGGLGGDGFARRAGRETSRIGSGGKAFMTAGRL